MTANKRGFELTIRNSRVFELISDLIAIVLSWYQTIKISKIGVTISQTSLLMSLPVTIKLRDIGITIVDNLVKLRIGLVQTIYIKKIAISATISQLMNFIFTLNIKKIVIDITMSLIEKFSVTDIGISKIGITATIIVAKFLALWEHDNKDLWEIDGVTLEDLDYTIT